MAATIDDPLSGVEPAVMQARITACAARVALIGLPTSRHSSHLRAAAGAPQRIAALLQRDEGNPWAENGIDLADPAMLADLGALNVDTPDDQLRLRTVADAVARAGRRGLFIGGDHAVSLPLISALQQHHRPLTVLHIDAHPDLYDELDGDRYSHACPFARLMEEGRIAGLWQYGIRTLNPHQRAQAQRFGVHCQTMREQARWTRPTSPGPYYVSIDLDGLDPSCAPGVAHREPGGLTVREVLSLVDALPGPVVGADVVEFHPQRDIGDLTALAAAKLVRELAGRMAADAA